MFRRKKPLSEDPFSNDAIQKFLESLKGERQVFDKYAAEIIYIKDIKKISELWADFLLRHLSTKRRKYGDFIYIRKSSKHIIRRGASIRRQDESKPAYIVRRIVEEIH